MCRNHFLLVPKGEQPQVLSLEALRLSLAFSFRASPKLWLSFNTLGAGASVNHLHLQGQQSEKRTIESTRIGAVYLSHIFICASSSLPGICKEL